MMLINALCLHEALAQDIFDLEHSRKYAYYLLQQKQFTEAAEEWNTILKLEPTDSNRYILLRTYRQAGLYNNAENFAEKYFLTNADMRNTAFTEEYVKTLLQKDANHKATTFLQSSSNILDTFKTADYTLQNYILQRNWQAARKLFDSNTLLSAHKDKSYESILLRAENRKYKSPALATGLAVVLPGLGKVYTGDWKDGAVALFLTGGSALQAYWGFREKGTRSVYGWIFGGLAIGYYTGSIFGSYKAAHRFNHREEELIIQDAKQVIFSTY